jgi:hypothetical protein
LTKIIKNHIIFNTKRSFQKTAKIGGCKMDRDKKLADAILILHGILVMLFLLSAMFILSLLFLPSPPKFVWLTKFIEKACYSIMFSIVISQVLWGGCPLTFLECRLRNRPNPKKWYERSFVCEFLEKHGINVPHWLITALTVIIFIISTIICFFHPIF